MKRAVIVHCLGGEPDYAWYPWVRQQLEAKGYAVSVPEMPEPEEPKLGAWLPCLQEAIGEPDDELVLVGHSIGAATVLRYLETLSDKQQVGKVVLVAGFTDPIGFKEFENFFKKPLRYEKIKSKSIGGFVAIQSDNDPYVADQYGDRLEEELDAELIIKHALGHMSGAAGEKGSCTKLPEVITEVTGTPVRARKFRISKAVRVVASAATLVVLLGAGGVGYTYYIDKQNGVGNAAAVSGADASPTAEAITPHKPAANAPESAAVELLSSPAARGSTASISVKTQPTSKCTIAQLYKNVASPIAGLGAKTADDFGTVSWSWTVSSAAPLGTSQIRVTCAYHSKTAMVQGDMQVTAK